MEWQNGNRKINYSW